VNSSVSRRHFTGCLDPDQLNDGQAASAKSMAALAGASYTSKARRAPAES
jgi:hypothetical protein